MDRDGHKGTATAGTGDDRKMKTPKVVPSTRRHGDFGLDGEVDPGHHLGGMTITKGSWTAQQPQDFAWAGRRK